MFGKLVGEERKINCVRSLSCYYRLIYVDFGERDFFDLVGFK